MARSPLVPAVVPKTYAELRQAVEVAMVHGQRAVELAKVRTYHETGRLIYEHVLLFKERADYGAKTIPKLADDLKLDRSTLLRCVQFFRAFPIVAAWRQLSWAHYRVLIPIEDTGLRQSLATEADRNGWPVVQLEQRIREVVPEEKSDPAALSGGAGGQVKLLVPKRGTPGLHPIVARGEGLAVDLGFKLYRRLPEATKLAVGDIVRIAADGSVRRAAEATKAELFCYEAELRRVIDGDTVVVALEVAPEIFVELKLRLRGLDCPELSTPEGKAAKRFVDGLVARSTAITINTTKPDKYDRYLADVFLGRAPGSEKVGASEGAETEAGEEGEAEDADEGEEIFLNNALLKNGQAVRKDAWEFRDWEPELLG